MQEIGNATTPRRRRYWLSPLVVLSACLVLLGAGGSLLIRVYFVYGGQRLWLSTIIQVSGWPLLLPPICASLLLRRRRDDDGSIVADHLLPPRLVGAVAVLGAFFAVACFAYSLGSQALPLSTSCLLQATQLTFNAFSAFLFVAGQRFTPFSVNAVALLTVGPAVLGARSPSAEKVPGEGGLAAYWTGFVECMASAALLGLVLPLVEAATPSPPPSSYIAVMGAAGTAVCLVDMAVSKGFQAMPGEAAAFGSSNLGIMGLIVCSSSLLAGVIIALVLPLSEVLAVVFLREKFDGAKGIALVLSLWARGFVSYLYGESTQKAAEVGAKGSEGLESICCPLMAT
ncbi:unnamed protein product [Urochloa decumbens]|uniref:Probable purine permease n=1 Tax=Urochloa decumbens TaxID=240449 RepID=A0ABC8WSK3_9POAL